VCVLIHGRRQATDPKARRSSTGTQAAGGWKRGGYWRVCPGWRDEAIADGLHGFLQLAVMAPANSKPVSITPYSNRPFKPDSGFLSGGAESFGTTRVNIVTVLSSLDASRVANLQAADPRRPAERAAAACTGPA
jgi:hypothetical protein